MPHSNSLRSTLFAALGAVALAGLPGAAAAQQAADGDAAPAAPACTAGAFGEGVSLTPKQGEDPAVTAVHLEFQCGDILSDGTFIPTGYRIELEGECGDAACSYPMAFVSETASPNRYEGGFVSDEGNDVMLRVRKTRNGVVLLMLTRTPGSGEKPERLRFRLDEG